MLFYYEWTSKIVSASNSWLVQEPVRKRGSQGTKRIRKITLKIFWKITLTKQKKIHRFLHQDNQRKSGGTYLPWSNVLWNYCSQARIVRVSDASWLANELTNSQSDCVQCLVPVSIFAPQWMAFQLKLPFLPLGGIIFVYNLISFLNRAVIPNVIYCFPIGFFYPSTVFHNFLRKSSCKMTLMIPLSSNIQYNKHRPSN